MSVELQIKSKAVMSTPAAGYVAGLTQFPLYIIITYVY